MSAITGRDMEGMVKLEVVREFESAAIFVMFEDFELDLSNEMYIYLHARYMQAAFGRSDLYRPNMGNVQLEDLEVRVWEAWRALRNMTREQAMKQFVKRVKDTFPGWRSQVRGKRSSSRGLGISVSVMLPEQDELSDEEKSVFDWCKEGKVQQVQLLLSREDANVNQVDDEGLTLLHWACDRGHLEVVTLLIELGINMNALDPDGQTPLHHACGRDYLLISELLVRCGSNVNVRDTDGRTPAYYTSSEDIRQLLESQL